MIDTSTSFVGTPLYMAPEVLTHKPHSTKTDIWSMGLVIYQLCTGQLPFPATSISLLQVPSPTPPYQMYMLYVELGLWTPVGCIVSLSPLGSSSLFLVLTQLKVMEAPPPIQSDRFSPELIQLVSDMMAVDPELRPSAATIAETPWVAAYASEAPHFSARLRDHATDLLIKWKSHRDDLLSSQSTDATNEIDDEQPYQKTGSTSESLDKPDTPGMPGTSEPVESSTGSGYAYTTGSGSGYTGRPTDRNPFQPTRNFSA
jgi:serine/threonine protein kinase